MRVDRLPRHLRRVHTILIDRLAKELGIKSKPILAYLAEIGYPLSPSYTIDGAVVVEVRAHFGKTAGDQGEIKTPSKPQQVPPDSPPLLGNVAELEAKLSKPGRVPPKIRVSSAGVTAEEGAAHKIGGPVERLSFKLLPPGTWEDMDYVISYYRREAHRFPADIQRLGIDQTRLEMIYKSLRISKCYRGEEQWRGYHAFEITGTSRVLLECPVKGNATYVLWCDWLTIAAHPKGYIWRHFPQSYRKIIHRDKREWLGRIKRALKLR